MLAPLPSPPPQAIIFDCDGTLAESLRAHFYAYRDGLTSAGVSLTYPEFAALFGLPGRRIVEGHLHSCGVTPTDTLVDGIIHEKNQAFQSYIEHTTPRQHIVSIVKHYHGRCPLAVASAGSREKVMGVLEMHNLTSYFSVIVSREDVAEPKPAPDCFALAATRLGVDAAKTWVFEDSAAGLEAARRFGAAKVIDANQLSPSSTLQNTYKII